MSKIIVDSIQKNGGVPLTVPAADGTAGQLMKTDGSGQLGFVDAPTTAPNTVVPPDSDNAYGFVWSSSARENIYSTGEWSSSGPWTTYYNTLQDATARTQAINMVMGDGLGEGSGKFYVGDHDAQVHRELLFAANQRIGHYYKDYWYQDNHTTANYSGITLSVLPIRNSSSAPVTISLKTYTSVGSNDYGGSGMVVYTPTPGTYSVAGATAGAWTAQWTHSSQDNNYQKTQSVTVPANSTVLIMLSSCHIYHTTYRFKDTHHYYDLHTTFTDAAINCDLRMLYTLQMGRRPTVTSSTDTTQELYTSCADLFGDR